MNKPSIYLESSVFSYLLNKPSQNLVIAARQFLANQWWETERQNYIMLISMAVISEVSEGDSSEKEKRAKFVSDLIINQEVAILEITEKVINLAEDYYRKLSLPPEAKDDALHLALSAEYQVKYFLTWNLKHFARRERIEEIRRLNAKLKIHQPFIVTPEDLLIK